MRSCAPACGLPRWFGGQGMTMAFAHALHKALALLHGGGFWFNTEETAAALRKLGARSVDAADISAMFRGPAF